ncbi:DNA pilot protein [Dipodfec virus UOA04_Rod_1109]|nr:DNA pilot protein [Dipodfec virus UOA04_Rod_1109]
MNPLTLAPLAGSLFNGIFGANSAKQQYKNQVKLMNLQYQHQIDFWNMNNEYNTPSAQMQRYEDAGVNPYVALGHSNTSQYGSVMQPTPTPPNYGDYSQGVIDNLLKFAQLKQMNAQSDLTSSQTEQTRGLTRMQDAIDRLNTLKGDALVSDVALKNQLYDFRTIMNSADYQLCVARYNETLQRIDNMSREYDLLGSRIRLTDAQINQVNSNIDLMRSQTKLNEAQIQLVVARAAGQLIDNTLNSANIPFAYSNAYNLNSLSEANAISAWSRSRSAESQAQYDEESLQSRINSSYFQSRTQAEQLELLIRYGDAQSIFGMLVPLIGAAAKVK